MNLSEALPTQRRIVLSSDHSDNALEKASPKRVLFLSNGHAEDNHSCQILKALRQIDPAVDVAGMPIVGEGEAYRRLQVPIIGPTRRLPSGGFFYMNPLHLFQDLRAGLIGLTWQQWRAVQHYARNCDLIMATGDLVSSTIAYSTGRPFVSFLSPLSSHYEGTLRLGLILWHVLQSPRCLTVFVKDELTAQDLVQQGLQKTKCVGVPIVDTLTPTGQDLQLNPEVPMIALLPGSRWPEAIQNFGIELQLVREIANVQPATPLQFRAALIPKLMPELEKIASVQGWHYHAGRLTFTGTSDQDGHQSAVEVICYSDAFADILHQTTLVIGMAGSAVEQAVNLGKPAIQIPGPGPQFTYRFAEAQMRLLGSSVQTVGTRAATPAILQQAAQRVIQTLQDADYLNACAQNAGQALGYPGSSERMARHLATYLH